MVTIGKYREIYNSATESIADHMLAAPHPRKKELLAYLKSGKPLAAIPMVAVDAVDGKTVIGTEAELTDGNYLWRSSLAYYVDKYDLQLPDDFVAHAIKQ